MPTYTRFFVSAPCTAARLLALCILSASSVALDAQSADQLVALGDRESAARRPAAALQYFERAVQAEPRSYVALYKASRDAVDAGEFETNTALRTTLYRKATDYARRAIGVDPTDAEGHFHLARALGRTALTLGPKERTRLAGDVRTQALKALELQPKHPGALHVMGVWNAEVMRLNGMQRMLAKAFLGGQVLGTASWDAAIQYLEQSVSIEPDRLVHHLDLARVFRDANRAADARSSYESALRAPLVDANDDVYRQAAESELRRLR